MANTPAIEVSIPRISTIEFTVPIIGTARLVTHQWSKKAKREMLDKMMHKPTAKRPPKDPKKEFEDSIYVSEDGWYGIPAISFKQSACSACRWVNNLTMVMARGTIFVIPDGYTEDGNGLVKISTKKPKMREDLVRIGMGSPDLRYRGEYLEWKAELKIQVNSQILSEEQIMFLFEYAGHHVGVGEGRPGAPKNTMDWGRFKLDESKLGKYLPQLVEAA